MTQASTLSAWWKERQNLDPQVFVALHHQAIAQFTSKPSSPSYCGFRLLVVEGTNLRLPATQTVVQAFASLSMADSGGKPPADRLNYSISMLLQCFAPTGSMLRTYREIFEELHIVRAPSSECLIFFSMRRVRNLTKARIAHSPAETEKTLLPYLNLSRSAEASFETVAELPDDTQILHDADTDD